MRIRGLGNGAEPFNNTWRSMSQARPHLDKVTTQHLSDILHKRILPTNLDPNHSIKIARGYYKPDLELLLNDKLIDVTGMTEQVRDASYIETMSYFVIQIYEELLSGQRRIFSDRFWTGRQGQLNMIICFCYMLENKCSLTMKEGPPHTIDEQLFKQNQRNFLQTMCSSADWAMFMKKFKLHGGFAQTFGNSIFELMKASYPWAFNLRTPEGQHLHPDDFRQDNLWQGVNGLKTAKQMVLHRLTKHLGLTINPGKQIFDQRLLRDNQTAFLASQRVTTWRDLFVKEGLEGLLVCRPEFHGRAGQALKCLFPWMFDWTRPAGQHCHAPDFEQKSIFVSDQEMREMIIHEATQDKIALEDLPAHASKAWLVSHGLSSLRNHPIITIFKKAFQDEFSRAVFSEAHFSRQNSLRQALYREIKATKAGNTRYGIFHHNGVAYYLPAEHIGKIIRAESADYGVIYCIRRLPSTNGPEGRKLKPIKKFPIAHEGTYSRPELSDFDPGQDIILPRHVRDELIELGIRPDALIQAMQARILTYLSKGNPVNSIQTFLRSMGLGHML